MSEPRDPPETLIGIVRQLGPGLIISANIVGSGELIVTTKLGADVGFTLLWFIIFGCMIKVLLQVELGRYAISKGKATLAALDTVPGPRFKVSWLVWCWLAMFVATFFQVSGMVGGIAGIFRTGGSELDSWIWALVITGSCAVLLFIGRYGFIEKFAAVMVASFTVVTILAVLSLFWTDYGITANQLAAGFRFALPDDFMIAFAAFGVIGVGASELIYYPYWCLEKGYARYVGPREDSARWVRRARGWIRVMRWDAWFSMVVYTGATVAFYLLGAAVLNARGLSVTNTDLVPTLSVMYSESFGPIGLWVFLFGAFAVLYSTIFISTASNGLLIVDALALFGLVRPGDRQNRRPLIRIVCVVLPTLYFIFYVTIREPVSLVLAGAIAQAMMLPFLSFGVLHFLYRQTEPELRPGWAWIFFLWISCLLMTVVGAYQLASRFGLI